MTVHGRGKYVSQAKRSALAAAAAAPASSQIASESAIAPPPPAAPALDAAPTSASSRVVPSTLPLPTDFGYSKSEVATIVRHYLQAEFPVVAKLFEHEAKHVLQQCATSSTPRSLYSIMREFVELKSAQRLSNAIRDYQRIRQPPTAIAGVLQGLNNIIGEYEARRDEFDNVDFNAPITQPAPVSNANNVLAQGTVSPAFASFFTTPINNATVSHSSFLPTAAAPASSRALASAFAPSPSANAQQTFQPVAAASSSSHTFAQPLPPVSRFHPPPPSTSAAAVSHSLAPVGIPADLSVNSTAAAFSGPESIPPSSSPNKRRRKGSSPKKRIIPTVVSNSEMNAAGLLTADAELPSNTLLEYLRGSVSKLQSMGLDMRVNPEGLDALEHNTDLAVVLANYINQTHPFDKHQSQAQGVPAAAAAAAASSVAASSSPDASNPNFLSPAPPIAHTTSAASAMEIQQHGSAMDTSDPDTQGSVSGGGVESFALSDDILREITEKCLQDQTTAAFIDNAFAFNPNRQAESMWSPTSQDSASMAEFETPMDSTTYTENSPHKSPQQQETRAQAAAASEQTQVASSLPAARSRSPSKAQSRVESTNSRDATQPSPLRATLRSASNGPVEASSSTTSSRLIPTASPSRSNSASSAIATRSLTMALNVSSASPRLRRGAEVSHQSIAASVAASAPLHSTSSNASATSDQESTVSTVRKKRKADSSV